MKNWRTSIFGTIGAISAGGASQTTGKVQGILALIATVCGSIFALSAKDANVTGGTVPQDGGTVPMVPPPPPSTK